MNEIILAPCDVISKIKQNSSDMNEIILAPCDAGYVQSCTGFYNSHILKIIHLGRFFNSCISIFGCIVNSEQIMDRQKNIGSNIICVGVQSFGLHEYLKKFLKNK
jgi:hypothetical protein